ncbi:hypothetical protein KQH62_03110 [bacterium]|nr:hypothetical protein [bacterium]
MKIKLEQFPYHVLLFPAATVLILAANNLGQIHLSVIWRPLLLVVAAFGLILLLAQLLLHDWQRAGIAVTVLALFSLTYGHFFDVMEGRVIGDWVVGTHFYMLILWGLLFLLAGYLLVFRLKHTKNLTEILNIMIFGLFLLQIGRITQYGVRVAIARAQTDQGDYATTLLKPEDLENLPDVYFIILDKYARSDAIQAAFDYDNTTFIQGLEDLGFWVPDCNRTNYAFTVMSLSSQLNLDYVENLTNEPNLKTTSALIQNNLVHQAFEEIGYTTVAFDMGYSWGNMKDSDYYFSKYPDDIETWALDPFEMLYVRSTIGVLIFENKSDLGAKVSLSSLERKAYRTTLILDLLPELPKLPGPKFVHAHIVNPHPPYVFNTDGTLNPDAEDIPESEGYPTQLAFLEPRILADIEAILEASDQPPIIILEGDHGFGKKYVTSNLLALYLPNGGAEGLDDHMTLINTFPHIFNTYFGTDLDLLPDRVYTHTKDWYESVPLEEWNPACKGE